MQDSRDSQPKSPFQSSKVLYWPTFLRAWRRLRPHRRIRAKVNGEDSCYNGRRIASTQDRGLSVPWLAREIIGMIGFFLGLGLICASTLMYEITLTRLLSVTCW